MAQMEVERLLEENGDWMKHRDIMVQMSINPSSLGRNLKSLLKWGLVIRRRCKDENRRVFEYRIK